MPDLSYAKVQAALAESHFIDIGGNGGISITDKGLSAATILMAMIASGDPKLFEQLIKWAKEARLTKIPDFPRK